MWLVEVVRPRRNRWKTRSFANRVGTAHEAVAVDAAERAGGAPVRALRTRRDQVERVVDARADDLWANKWSLKCYEMWKRTILCTCTVPLTSMVNVQGLASFPVESTAVYVTV